ncbi:MAG TPA: SDR family oxidoreductase [Tepidisphaeraceae bacterium]|nr:SDR family oxidoreductase [Tepidisphaeraceae bacterium]
MSDFVNAFTLDGEVALITGGGSGLGLGMARCMAQAGARVVLVGRRRSVLDDACASIGERAVAEPYDVTQFDQADAMVQRVTERVGSITILANNAGIHLKRPAVETTIDGFNSVLQTHVLAAHNLTRAVLPGMISRKHGSVLFMASMASLMGLPQVIAYSAAKSAYVGMVRTLSTEVAQHGVRVNAIAPGWIESDMLHKALDGDPPRKAKILARTSMARFGVPDDIGWAAVYLCSPAAKFVTGVVLPVDGGASSGF